MKKVLIMTLLLSIGIGSMLGQSVTKKGNVTKSTVSRKINSQKAKSTKQKRVTQTKVFTQEEYDKTLEGVPYVSIIPFSEYSPQVAGLYDVHTLKSTVVLIFNMKERKVVYSLATAIDPDLIVGSESRGSLIQQQGLGERFTRTTTSDFTQDGDIFTFEEEFERDGKTKKEIHKYKYNPQTNTMYDLERKITHTKYELK